MTRLTCPREGEAVRAARAGAGLAEGSDLAAHLASCAACLETVSLAAAFRAERDAACAEARPPAASLLWWKEELRSRHEQACDASRPILVAHAAALVSLLLAILALLAWLMPRVGDAVRRLDAWPRPALDFPVPPLDLALPAQPGILLAAAAALVLAPLAVYLALTRE